jgi:uncharacterized protein
MEPYSFKDLRLAPTELIVLQPTTLCNLDCEYCFLPRRKENLTLPIGDLALIFKNLAQDCVLEAKTSVCWHLGEPTVLPVEYYRAAHEVIRRASPQTTFQFQIQTNGTKIDEQWCDFFLEERMTVGLSIDGNNVHNSRRKDWRGEESFDRIAKGLANLQARNIDCYVIAVLSREALTDAKSFYNFFVSIGVKQLCLNIVESEGGGIPSFLQDETVFDSIEHFYSELWEIVANDPDPIWIREIDHSQQAIVSGQDIPNLSQEMTAGRILTILHNGDTLPFTPGFATLQKETLERFVVGNLLSGPLSASRNRNICEFLDDAVFGLREKCLKGCEFYSVCGGGSPAHRWAEFGHFNEHVTRTCQASVQSRMRGIVSSISRRISDHKIVG